MASISAFCPDADELTQTAEAVSKILNRPRPTFVGWINRYPWLGIPNVTPGTTRLFSIADIGMLAVMRLALSARVPAEALMRVEGLREHVHEVYDELRTTATMDNGIPYMPMPANPAYIRAQEYMSGTVFGLNIDRTAIDGAQGELMDLSGFPVPIVILPMDAAIRNAWRRTLRLRAGLELDD